MKLEEFKRDVDIAERKYRFHLRVGSLLRNLSFGLLTNHKNILKYQHKYEINKAYYDKYKSLLRSADEIDKSIETIVLNGVRVGKHTFSDLPVIDGEAYGINWGILREQVLSRDAYECQESDGYCKGPLQIHHRIPLSKGGSNSADNLETLCVYHHSLKHEHMRNKYHGDLWS
jgi:hypothetical protein